MGLRFPISKELPGDANAAGPWTISGTLNPQIRGRQTTYKLWV